MHKGNEDQTRWLLHQFESGKMNRRTFVTSLMALGAAMPMSSALGKRALAQSAPKKGGHFRFGMAHGEAADTLDPAHVNNGFTTVVAYAITNMLTEEDAHGNVQPRLAESWEPSDKATTWVFKLRRGVEFHDGRPLTAKDVIASINHHRGEASTSSAKPTVEPIVSIEADGDYDVIIKLSGGDADLPAKLSMFSFGIYPAKEDGTLDWESGIGTGAYRLKKFSPGERATFERNPNFWQENRGFFDSGELLVIHDAAARQNALITNEVDAIDRVDLKSVDRLAKADDVIVRELRGKLQYTFPMRTDMAPFNDVNVRLALKHAIDRQSILGTVLFGHGALGNDHPITPAYRFFAEGLEQRTYDPEKSKFYLKQAGLSDLSVDLSAADAAFAGAVDAALLYKEHAAKANININVVREPNDGYWSNVWMQKPFCAAYWFGTPTVDGILSQAYGAGASWNDSYWDNEQFNRLLSEARGELDAEKRADMYREMQVLIRDDGGVVIPVFANDVFAIRDNVRHGELASNYEVDGRMMFDRWWFE